MIARRCARAGSFFTNIQIHCSQKVSLEIVEATVDKVAKKAGLARCTKNAAEIDRTILIRWGDGLWISLYDESTEDQDSTKLDVLGKALSESTQRSSYSFIGATFFMGDTSFGNVVFSCR
jgi:hypothetical protein